MDLKYRLSRDPDFRVLYNLLGEPNCYEDDTKCLVCGEEIEEGEEGSAVFVQWDLEHNTPDQWWFCSPACLKARLESRTGRR